ncbi:MAG: M23 family metallopeptidase [bacterium]
MSRNKLNKKKGLELIIASRSGEEEAKSIYLSIPKLILYSICIIIFICGVIYLIYGYTHSIVDARLVSYLNETTEKKQRKIEILEKTIPQIEDKISEIKDSQLKMERGLQLDKANSEENSIKMYKTISLDEVLVSAQNMSKKLEELYLEVKSMGENRKNIPSLKPTEGWILRRFGYYQSPFTGSIQMHRGIDIVGRRGQPIVASADGIVIFSGLREGYGLTVEIDHNNGYSTVYCHNKGNTVKAGDMVRRGQIIAFMGSTGRSSGTHLHYEVKYIGKNLDPEPFLFIE